MSNENLTFITDEIITSILSLYTKHGRNFHLRTEEHCFTLREFLECILPYVADITWPVDKDEIGRISHFLYAIRHMPTTVDMALEMPPASSSPPAEEVLLHSQYISRIIRSHPSRSEPNLCTLNIDPQTGYQTAPVSEIRLASFTTCWYMSNEAYVTRFSIIKDASTITLFIAKKRIWNGCTRFNLTWLPHFHLRAMRVEKRYKGYWASVTVPEHDIWSATLKGVRQQSDISILVWNVRQDLNTRFARQFNNLLAAERPKLIILTSTGIFDTAAREVINSVGYDKVTVENSEEGMYNGFWVIWKQTNDTIVREHACYPNSKHIRIQAAQMEGTVTTD